jgi:hypothetical protein
MSSGISKNADAGIARGDPTDADTVGTPADETVGEAATGLGSPVAAPPLAVQPPTPTVARAARVASSGRRVPGNAGRRSSMRILLEAGGGNAARRFTRHTGD